jgi:hypothetical protein
MGRRSSWSAANRLIDLRTRAWRRFLRRTSPCSTTTAGAAATVGTRRRTRSRSKISTPSSKKLVDRHSSTACPRGGPRPRSRGERSCHHEAGALGASVRPRREPPTAGRPGGAVQRDDRGGSARRRDRVLHVEGRGPPARVRRPRASPAVLAGPGDPGAHARLRHHPPGRRLVAGRAGGGSHGTHARDHRWGELPVHARDGAGARGRHSRCAAPRPGGSGAPRSPGGPRSRVGGVLRRRRQAPGERRRIQRRRSR